MTLTVLIAAGGLGTRFGGGPKARVEVDGRPLLFDTIAELSQISCDKIVVFCGESTEWSGVVESGASDPRVVVRQSTSAGSSLGLVQSYDDPGFGRLLFLYGHAPRPVEHLRTICELPAPLVVTTVGETTRRQPIGTSDGRYIEPPFAFDSAVLQHLSTSNDWSEAIRVVRARIPSGIVEVPLSGPPEINYSSELEAYAAYVRELRRRRSSALPRG